MKNFLIIIGAFIFYCHSITAQQTNIILDADVLKIEQISDHSFVHISYLKTNDFGNVACNGMVYINNNEAIIFDTPTTNAASEKLIQWLLEKKVNNIKAVVATHFHIDCIGGLEPFHKKGIPSYASDTTLQLLKEKNQMIIPHNGFEQQIVFTIGKEKVYTTFYGEGHTVDNVVGHIPSDHVLFGGCLVKSVNAGKGNLEDANVSTWSETIEKIKVENPDLSIVVPGHGKTGGTELLDFTIQLFENK